MTNKEAGHASCELCDDEREAAWSQDTQRSEASQPILPGELVEAVEDVLSLRTQPGETPTATFDRLADAFHRHTGFMRPGKSVPCEMEEMVTEEERWTAWNEWCLAKYERLTAALALPRKTEAEIRADERERLLTLALGGEDDGYYARDGYVAEWLRSHMQEEG